MFLANDLTQDLFFYENADASELGWNHLSMLKGVSEGKMIRYPIQRYEPCAPSWKPSPTLSWRTSRCPSPAKMAWPR